VSAPIGKFKASQNRSEADRAGVMCGLRAEGVTDEAVGELLREPHC
jgi:predicted FMN-binding regulatory protein PaiB